MLVRVLDGIDAFLDQLTSVHPWPLFLAVLAQLGKLSCTSMAWRNVLAAAYPGVRVKRRSILGAYLAGVGINAIIPARAGDAVRIVLAHRAIQNSTYTTVVSSTLVLSLFDMAAASFFLAWAIGIGGLPGIDVLSHLRSFDFAWILARPLLFDLTAASSVLLWATITQDALPGIGDLPRLPSFEFSWILQHPEAMDLAVAGIVLLAGVLGFWIHAHVLDFWARVKQAFTVLRSPVRYLGTVAIWQAGDWFLRMVAIWFLLAAFDIPQSVENVLLVQVSASIATLIPLTPAGIGTEQAFLLYVFRGTVASSKLLAFSVGLKLVTVGTNVVAGFTAIGLTLRTLRYKSALEPLEASAEAKE